MKESAVTPSGQHIIFDDTAHTYTVFETDERLISATTFIGQFFPKFNADEVAQKCVGKPAYEGLTADQIKAQWNAEGDRGRNEGTNVHSYCEAISDGECLPEPRSPREAAIFKVATRAILELQERFEYIESEKIIASPGLGIAGTMDYEMVDRVKQEIVIIDWKQNKKIKMSNPWQTAYKPIDDLDSCDWIKYCLQLNLYKKILTCENYYPEIEGYRLRLIHLTEGGYFVYPVPDMTDRVEQMIEYAQKKHRSI